VVTNDVMKKSEAKPNQSTV